MYKLKFVSKNASSQVKVSLEPGKEISQFPEIFESLKKNEEIYNIFDTGKWNPGYK